MQALTTNKMLFMSIFFSLAILFVYLMPTPTVKQTGKNVGITQLLFCFLYLYFSGTRFKQLLPSINAHRLSYSIVAIAAASMLYSYISFVSENSNSAGTIRLSTYQVLFMLTHCFFGLCIYHGWRNNIQYLKKPFIFTPVIAGLLALAYFLFTYITEPSMQADDWFYSPPLSGHIRNMGWLINIASVSGLVFLMYCKSTSKQFFLSFFVSTANIAFLFWTGGRAALGSFIICTAIIFFTSLYQGKNRTKIFSSLAVLLLAVFIADQSALSEKNGISRSTKVVEATSKSNINLNQVTTGRLEMWATSLAHIQKKPFFGYGPNAYLRVTPELYGSQPHNFLIQFLYDWGIIGTTPILLFFAYCLLISAKLIFMKPLTACALQSVSLFILLLSNSFFSGTLYHAQALFFFSLAVAILIASYKNLRHDVSKS